MTTHSARTRTAARCVNCRSIFASEIGADGEIRPIGVRDGCTCGNGEFRSLA